MPLRIRVPRGIPRDLLAEHDPTVLHGSSLAVARPEVEADSAAVEMATECPPRISIDGELVARRRDDLERPPVDRLAHRRGVEAANCGRPVVAAQVLDD